MSRTTHATRCVVHGTSRGQLATPDAVVIIVIAVLACLMERSGSGGPAALTVLTGAGLLSTIMLLLLRGARSADLAMRALRAVSAP
ncbi:MULTISPECIES: hypothetical protein [unclassified Streptomyces]|uniref:hypothetical protein n=1 Tax=unclassified Streptomyces TaxID=2593676 RepID=UPI0011CDFD4A|nr:hypothetical protein [Streptomyces sp. col6]